MTGPGTATSETLFCTFHPQRETLLRCNLCGRPMCTECLVLVPTGYRCKECVARIHQGYEKAGWTRTVLLGVTAFLMSLFGGVFLPRIGFWLIFVTPVWAYVVAEALLRMKPGASLRAHRAILAGVWAGSLLPLLNLNLLGVLLLALGGAISPMDAFAYLGFQVLWQALYAVLLWTIVRQRVFGLSIWR